ncbi:MAG: hypothetical protein ACR2QC_01495 [Gammaproteobacteria bacterium]
MINKGTMLHIQALTEAQIAQLKTAECVMEIEVPTSDVEDAELLLEAGIDVEMDVDDWATIDVTPMTVDHDVTNGMCELVQYQAKQQGITYRPIPVATTYDGALIAIKDDTVTN